MADSLHGDRPLRDVGRWADLSDAGRAAMATRGLAQLYDETMRSQIVALVDDVRQRGDDALVDAIRRFDGCTLDAGRLAIDRAEIEAGYAATSPDVLHALEVAIDHVRRFNELVCERGGWTAELDPGLIVGERVTPIESAGLFVPSGKGSFPSVLVQLAVPAQVAGVSTIAVVVPPVPGGSGEVDPAVLATCRLLGLDAVFRANGPSGIAALAFGTGTIPKVRFVVGPGSPAVTCAQVEVQRFGTCTTMVLGPTESMVIADHSADADTLAADLLNEAEHGADSASFFVTDSPTLIELVQGAVARRLQELPEPRRSYAASSLGVNGGVVLVDDLDEACDVANAYAPEHLMVVVRNPDPVVARLEHAGEILLGDHTPFAAANYVIGCPASLPTSGFAKVSSGVTVDTFRKRTAVARADAVALRNLAPAIVALARHEGFPAHEAAVVARLDG